VKKEHPDGIDAIINNAGVNLNPEGYSLETIKNTLKINYYGTKSVNTCIGQELIRSDVR
jgi:carbonyl reductase 1